MKDVRKPSFHPLGDAKNLRRVDAANAALEAADLGSPSARKIVLELADALSEAGMYAEVVGLALASRGRWPDFPELEAHRVAAETALGQANAKGRVLCTQSSRGR